MTEQPAAAISGPSFPVAIKALATLMVLVLLMGFGLAVDDLRRMDLPAGAQLLLGAAGLLVLVGYLSILFNRTTLSSTHISEGWLLRTEVALLDIVQVKWLRWRLLDAVMVPRLVVRVKGRGVVTFHVADPALRERVDHIVHLGPQV